jgi:hypothetical protein
MPTRTQPVRTSSKASSIPLWIWALIAPFVVAIIAGWVARTVTTVTHTSQVGIAVALVVLAAAIEGARRDSTKSAIALGAGLAVIGGCLGLMLYALTQLQFG